MSNTACRMCGASLSTLETVFAAEGALYCSANCGRLHFMSTHNADVGYEFEDIVEEVQAIDIGLESPKYMRRDAIRAAIKELAKSQGLYSRLDFTLSQVEKTAPNTYDKYMYMLEEKKFKDTLDLVLFFET